jgi:hypothetical protein
MLRAELEKLPLDMPRGMLMLRDDMLLLMPPILRVLIPLPMLRADILPLMLRDMPLLRMLIPPPWPATAGRHRLRLVIKATAAKIGFFNAFFIAAPGSLFVLLLAGDPPALYSAKRKNLGFVTAACIAVRAPRSP